MRLWVLTSWEALRATLWFVPTIMTLIAMALSFFMVGVDTFTQETVVENIGWVWAGGPEGAREVLSTIAGSMIGIAGVTFSITIVALSLASSQFGPRLLRNFMRDTGNQVVLGTFIATFVYCLLVLRTVRGDTSDSGAFVPHLSITIGLLLAVMSLGVLIYFIHHVSVSIQAPEVVAVVAQELEAALERLFPEKLGKETPADKHVPSPPRLPEEFPQAAHPLLASTSGHLQAIDNEQLLQLTMEHDLVVALHCRPGDFLVRGTPFALVWPHERVNGELTAALNAVCIIGTQRTLTQDAEFALHQLVEIAIRALSPSINDPFTAISCIDRLGAALCQLCSRRLPESYRYDTHGCLRVITPPVTFAQFVESAFSQIRSYGCSSVTVTQRLLEALAVIAACTQTPEQRAVIMQQAKEIISSSRMESITPHERKRLTRHFRSVLHVLRTAQAKASTDECAPMRTVMTEMRKNHAALAKHA